MKLIFGKNTTRAILYSIFIFTLQLHAGGTSDGGGGVTNPSPANAEWIASTIKDYAAPAILGFLNREEASFFRQSQKDQNRSPYRKLFTGEQNIFDLLPLIKIQIQMTEPCFDRNGITTDGSVNPRVPNEICISPFRMAPKLSENNFEAETIALVLHEISHLKNTDEAEAQRIQADGVMTFSHIDLLNFVVNVKILSHNKMGELLTHLRLLTLIFSSASDISMIYNKLLTLRDEQIYSGGFLSGLQFLRQSWIDRISPHFSLLNALQTYFYANDTNKNSEYRQYYRQKIQEAFLNEQVISAHTYEERTSTNGNYGPEWDFILIEKPVDQSSIERNIQRLIEFLEPLQQQLLQLNDVRFSFDIKR